MTQPYHLHADGCTCGRDHKTVPDCTGRLTFRLQEMTTRYEIAQSFADTNGRLVSELQQKLDRAEMRLTIMRSLVIPMLRLWQGRKLPR